MVTDKSADKVPISRYRPEDWIFPSGMRTEVENAQERRIYSDEVPMADGAVIRKLKLRKGFDFSVFGTLEDIANLKPEWANVNHEWQH